MSTINETSGIETLLGSRAYYIEIYSFSNPSSAPNGGTTIRFPAFLTDFTDSFKSNWKSEEVYGRMDPISTFKNTLRSITLAFDIPSESIQMAKLNMERLDFLIRGLYPIYDNGALGTATLASPPMFRVRFANLVRNVSQNDFGDTLRSGLLCYIENFDFKPKVDSGFFQENSRLFPKLISANLNLKIIHEHPLGKQSDGNVTSYRNDFKNFPHGNPDPTPQQVKAFLDRQAKQQAQNQHDQAKQNTAEGSCLGEYEA